MLHSGPDTDPAQEGRGIKPHEEKSGTWRKSTSLTHDKEEIAMKREPKWISEPEAVNLGIDGASKTIKELAKQQRIVINLSAEQMNTILRAWGALDNSRPAEITFHVEGEEAARLRVAAYGYFKDTCCV